VKGRGNGTKGKTLHDSHCISSKKVKAMRAQGMRRANQSPNLSGDILKGGEEKAGH